MKIAVLASSALAVLGCAGLALAQKPDPASGPGWTGLTNPEDVIAAREALMMAVERLMQPIDTLQVEKTDDPEEISVAAARISQIMLALPHLFPPTTNLYDPNVDTPKTLALPTVWQSWPTFYRLAAASAESAEKLSTTSGYEAMRAGAIALRGTCDACHATYLRPFEESEVTDEDVNFDFDSVLK